jgi:hypothetical protein
MAETRYKLFLTPTESYGILRLAPRRMQVEGQPVRPPTRLSWTVSRGKRLDLA